MVDLTPKQNAYLNSRWFKKRRVFYEKMWRLSLNAAYVFLSETPKYFFLKHT